MTSAAAFVEKILSSGVKAITGVPDSLLKEFCAEVAQAVPVDMHWSAPNEGSAIGMAVGHYLASSQPAVVYLQNSGLGNAVNPIVSLSSTGVFGIPMVLIIGWRGEVNTDGNQIEDEPQHLEQGRITEPLLDLLGIPYCIIDAQSDSCENFAWAYSLAKQLSRPVALLIRKGTFPHSGHLYSKTPNFELTREAALAEVLRLIPETVAVVATTGMASREVFEIRQQDGSGHHRDLLIVGGMGHATSVAVGISKSRPDRRVVCIDGDGALIMHAGALALAAQCDNLIHVTINNQVHDSVGGQPSAAADLSLSDVALAFGYGLSESARDSIELRRVMLRALSQDRSAFIEVLCRGGHRKNLGRPDRSPRQNVEEFRKFLSDSVND